MIAKKFKIKKVFNNVPFKIGSDGPNSVGFINRPYEKLVYMIE